MRKPEASHFHPPSKKPEGMCGGQDCAYESETAVDRNDKE